MVVFLDNFGCLLAYVDDVNFGLLLSSDDHHLLTDAFDFDVFVFGSILDLMTSLPTHPHPWLHRSSISDGLLQHYGIGTTPSLVQHERTHVLDLP